jgi:polyribonucleotide nucleotidyltransferase
MNNNYINNDENSDINNEDLMIIAMEVGYQAVADLVNLYKEINRELLKQLSIFEGKSTKNIKQQISQYLQVDGKEKELLLKIKASQDLIKRLSEEK